MSSLNRTLIASLLVIGGQAEALILYSGPQNISIPVTFGGVYLDIVPATTNSPSGSDGSPDLPASDSFTVAFTEPAEWDVNFFFGGVGIAHTPDFNPYREDASDSLSPVQSLGIGTIIDGSTASGPVTLPPGGSNPLTTASFGGSGDNSGNAATNHVGSNAFQFANGTEGYIAFVLDDEGTTYNGWMRVTLNDNGTPGTIHDWAYDTSPITVGVIPEPGSSVLLLLGTALLLRRNRS